MPCPFFVKPSCSPLHFSINGGGRGSTMAREMLKGAGLVRLVMPWPVFIVRDQHFSGIYHIPFTPQYFSDLDRNAWGCKVRWKMFKRAVLVLTRAGSTSPAQPGISHLILHPSAFLRGWYRLAQGWARNEWRRNIWLKYFIIPPKKWKIFIVFTSLQIIMYFYIWLSWHYGNNVPLQMNCNLSKHVLTQQECTEATKLLLTLSVRWLLSLSYTYKCPSLAL